MKRLKHPFFIVENSSLRRDACSLISPPSCKSFNSTRQFHSLPTLYNPSTTATAERTQKPTENDFSNDTQVLEREDELAWQQSRQILENSLEDEVMNELYQVVSKGDTTNAPTVANQSSSTVSIFSEKNRNLRYGMVTGRMGRKDVRTPETEEELLLKFAETRNNPIVKELIKAHVDPERVIDLVDRLRDTIRLEYISYEQYQAIFQKLITSWLELGNPIEAQEAFCRYFESWYRLQVQVGSVAGLGRPKMQNRQLYMRLASDLAEQGELHMVQKLAQGYVNDYTASHIVLEKDSINLLHSALRAYIKRGTYPQLMNFFTRNFDTIFGRLPLDYENSKTLVTPTHETYMILFDGFFTLQPKHVSAEELISLLISYRDECPNSTESQTRQWTHDILNYLMKKESKPDAAHDLFVKMYSSSLNRVNPTGLQPHLEDYQLMLELYADAGATELFDTIFHTLLTDEHIEAVSDAFYALRVKVFAADSLQMGLDKFNTHFNGQILREYSDHELLEQRAFYDPVREPHYVAIVSLSDAAVREENLDLAQKTLQSYEENCSVYSKDVQQYFYTNLLRTYLALDLQEDAFNLFKKHFKSPLYSVPEDAADFAVFDDVDEACMLLVQSFLSSGDLELAARLLEYMKSPPDWMRDQVNQRRRKLEEQV